jgi:hypothetical protein
VEARVSSQPALPEVAIAIAVTISIAVAVAVAGWKWSTETLKAKLSLRATAGVVDVAQFPADAELREVDARSAESATAQVAEIESIEVQLLALLRSRAGAVPRKLAKGGAHAVETTGVPFLGRAILCRGLEGARHLAQGRDAPLGVVTVRVRVTVEPKRWRLGRVDEAGEAREQAAEAGDDEQFRAHCDEVGWAKGIAVRARERGTVARRKGAERC